MQNVVKLKKNNNNIAIDVSVIIYDSLQEIAFKEQSYIAFKEQSQSALNLKISLNSQTAIFTNHTNRKCSNIIYRTQTG